jgi:hypothetical protein
MPTLAMSIGHQVKLEAGDQTLNVRFLKEIKHTQNGILI